MTGPTGPQGPTGAVSMLAYFEGVQWSPSVPTTDIANLVDQQTLNFGVIPFATGQYLIHINVQIGWNAGPNGANNRNGTFTLFDGVDNIKEIKWGRLKTGSTGHGYGTAQGYAHSFIVNVTQGNELKLQASTEAYLLGGQLFVYNLPAYTIGPGSLS